MKNKIEQKFTTEQQEFINKFVYGEIMYNNETELYDITGSIIIENSKEELKIPLKIGVVRDNFIIDYININKLENLPAWVGGNFEIRNCTFGKNDIEITTRYVGGNFMFYDNNNINDITQIPKYIGGDFRYEDNINNLKVVPEYVGADMIVWCDSNYIGKVPRPKKLIGFFRNVNSNDFIYNF